MYVIRNALRNISRSKGRSILILIIILVIVVSSCVALSIRHAAEQARADGLAKLNITAQITPDREKMMEQARPDGDMSGDSSGSSDSSSDSSSIDKDKFKEQMQSMTQLSLSELKKYAEADAVKDFYYTGTISVDAAGSTDAVETTSGNTGFPGGGPVEMSGSGDLTLTGYSSDTAMTDFSEGSKAITDGTMFEEGTSDLVCVVSEEFAEYNSLEVGSKIKVADPDNSKKKVTLKVTGIYESSQTSDADTMGMPARDSSNQIYTSYAALKAISKTLDMDISTNGFYTFASSDDYEAFEEQAKALGLDDNFTVTSQDVTQFENSLQPLENLSKYATYFLIVVLAIGITVLVIINIFSIRERKYEVGVLTAMGMKKKNVALQFLTETLAITLIAIIIGTSVGAATSVPITNSLLSSSAVQTTDSFDRGGPGGDMGQAPGAPPDGGSQINQDSESSDSGSSADSSADTSDQQAAANNGSDSSDSSVPDQNSSSDQRQGPGFMDRASNYISSISSATDMTVVFEMLVLGLMLSLVSSAAAISYVMRYEPLSILSNRD